MSVAQGMSARYVRLEAFRTGGIDGSGDTDCAHSRSIGPLWQRRVELSGRSWGCRSVIFAGFATARGRGGGGSCAWGASGRRAPLDQIEWVLEQYRTRYWDFTAKHFHEHLVRDHGFPRPGIRLQEAGLVKKARARGAHPRGGRAGPCRGCSCCSPHRWLVAPRPRPHRHHGRRHGRGRLGLPGRGCTFSSFRGLRETIEKNTPTAAATTSTAPRPAAMTPDPGRPGPIQLGRALARGQGAHALRHPARAPPPGGVWPASDGRGQPLAERP